MPTAEVKGAERVPGEQAEKPQEIPAGGWFQIAKRGWAEAKDDNVPLMAAGMAYYAFLAIFPAIIAAVLLYGFFADPKQITAQIDALGSAVPPAIKDTITSQITTAAGNGAVGVSAVVAILLALFSASGGMGNLMTAVNLCYDEEETRGFVKKRAIALALTLGAIVFFLVVIALIAVLPAVLSVFGTNGFVLFLIQAARWVLLVVLILVALAVLYRVAPDRDAPKFRWTSVGAGASAVLIILASIGISLYTSGIASGGTNPYQKTYGAIAGVVVLLLWLFVTAYAILLGAEINAESEQQTIKDTTKGPAQPIGSRDAVKADSVPDGADQGADTDSDQDKNSSSTNRSATKDSAMTENTPSTTGAVTAAATTSSGEPSLGDLIRNMSTDLSSLVRDEIRLAQAEVGQKAKKAGIGIGAFGGAGVVALYGLGVLIAAAVLGLAHVVDPWLSALIVGVVLFLVAGVAALFGKKQLSKAAPPVPTQAIASVKTDVAEIKESIRK